jgi:anti-anti-sigma factor
VLITHDVRDNCQLFCLDGLFDAFAEPSFRKVLDEYVDDEPKNFILDLSMVDFVDSSGLGALVQLVKKVQSAGGTLQVVSNPRVTQTVKLLRLEQFLSLQESVDVAFENLKKN